MYRAVRTQHLTCMDMFKDTMTVAAGTAASRITGLLRVVVLGVVLGQTALADAFDGANNSPNSIYELLVGGLLAASLVPLFTRFVVDEDDEATIAVVSVAVIVLVVATVVAVLLAPFIFGLYSLRPSDLVDADQYRRAGTAMARVFLVQILFYGLTAIGTALLNARNRFAMAAWAPVLANVVSIVVLAAILATGTATPTLDDAMGEGGFFWLLTLSTTGGIAAMALVLVPALVRAKVPWGFRPRFGHPAVRSMLRMSAWTFGYVLTNQVALIVIKNLAEPGSGNQDAYAKAYVFFMLPHSLLTLSIATTFVPELVKRVNQSDSVGFRTRLTTGLRWTVLLTAPATMILTVLAHPIIATILQHGNFGPQAVTNTSRALVGLAVGLVGFSVFLFTLRGFYAHNDTRTPFVLSLVQNSINIVLAVVLVGRFDVLGLGMSFGVSYLVAAGLVTAIIHARHRAIEWSTLRSIVSPLLLATIAMGLVMWWIHELLDPTAMAGRIIELIVAIGTGCAVYLFVLHVAGVPDARSAVGAISRRSRSNN